MLSNARSTVEAAGARSRGRRTCSRCCRSRICSGSSSSGAAPLLAGGRVTHDGTLQSRARRSSCSSATASRSSSACPRVFTRCSRRVERRGVDAARLSAAALHLRRRAAVRASCRIAGPTSPASSCAGLRTHRSRPGVSVQSRRPAEHARHARRALPGRATCPSAPRPATTSWPSGDDGEICIAGPNVFAGYVNAAAHVVAADDPWSAPGCRATASGCAPATAAFRTPTAPFTFRGLLKPMFTRNGFNIYPREIERVVARAARRARVRACTAIPDAARGERHRASRCVGDVTVADVKAWCDERLRSYKRPSVITIRDDADVA